MEEKREERERPFIFPVEEDGGEERSSGGWGCGDESDPLAAVHFFYFGKGKKAQGLHPATPGISHTPYFTLDFLLECLYFLYTYILYDKMRKLDRYVTR